MRIILEGADNSGKTTLAKAIIVQVGGKVQYHHPGGPPATFQDEIDDIQRQLDQVTNPASALLDRVTAISQQVYNPSAEMREFRVKMVREMVAKGVIIIYCRPSFDKLMQTDAFAWREGESEEHKQKIIRNQHRFVADYDRVFMTIPHLVYDYGEPNAALLLERIVAGLKGDELQHGFLHSLMNYNVIQDMK